MVGGFGFLKDNMIGNEVKLILMVHTSKTITKRVTWEHTIEVNGDHAMEVEGWLAGLGF